MQQKQSNVKSQKENFSIYINTFSRIILYFNVLFVVRQWIQKRDGADQFYRLVLKTLIGISLAEMLRCFFR